MVDPIFPSYTKWDNFDYENAQKEIEQSQPKQDTVVGMKKKTKSIQEILILINETIVKLSKKLKEIRNEYLEEKFEVNRRRRRRKKREKYSTYSTILLSEQKSWTFEVNDSILHVKKNNDKSREDRIQRFNFEENKIKAQMQQIKLEETLLLEIMNYHGAAQKYVKMKKFDMSLYEYKKGINSLLTYEKTVINYSIQKNDELSNGTKVGNMSSLHHGAITQQKHSYVSFIVPPYKDDISCCISFLKNDFFLGAGMVEYKLKKWDCCVETLKEVKGNNKQVNIASIIRANAFKKMDAPGFSNKCLHNAISCETKQSIAWIETDTSHEQKKGNSVTEHGLQKSTILFEQSSKQNLGAELIKTLSAKDMIKQAFLYYRQANAIWNEHLFHSSAKKFCKAALYLNQAEMILRTPLPSILNRVQSMSFLGYVLSCFKINNHFATAESKCTDAIQLLQHEYNILLKSKMIFIFFMCRAACRAKLMRFDDALDDMQKSLKICTEKRYKNAIKIRINLYRFLGTQLELENAKKNKGLI